MILVEADKPTYFPTVTYSGPALVGALQMAQLTLETEAGRSLEIQQYHETIKAPVNQMAGYPNQVPMPFFSGLPVANELQLRYCPVALNQPITLHGYLDSFSTPVDIAADQYQLDTDGKLILKRYYPTIQISYWSGFDFTQDSPMIRQIKTAAAAILNYQLLS